jgi:hypothetical protein
MNLSENIFLIYYTCINKVNGLPDKIHFIVTKFEQQKVRVNSRNIPFEQAIS